MELYTLTKSLHYLIGIAALGSFWIAGLSRKGSRVHTTAGKVYLLAMAGIIASALVMTVIGTISGPGPRDAFFGYLLVITSTSCWLSWRAIRDKRDFARYTGPIYRMLAVLNLVAGVGIFVVGISIGSTLFSGFSLIGVYIGFDMFRTRRRGPDGPLWWRGEHIAGMLGNGVATHIAFLSIGLPKLLPMLAGGTLQMLAWFGPLAIATVLGIWLKRKYPSAPIRSANTTPVLAKPL